MSGMFLNFCECKLEYDKSFVYKTNFINKDILRELRAKYSNVTFYRQGMFIYFWNNIINEAELNLIDLHGERVEITLEKEPKIFSKMLEIKIIDIFKQEQHFSSNIYLNKYSNTWEVTKDIDLFGDDGLKVYRSVSFNTFYSQNSDKTLLGFCISTRLKNRFSWGRKEFEKNGISCIGLSGREDVVFSNKVAIKRYLAARGLEKKYNNLIYKENELTQEFKIIRKTIEWIAEKLNGKHIYNSVKVLSCVCKYLPYDDNIMNYSIITKPNRYYANDKVGDKGRYDEQLMELFPYTVSDFTSRKINIVLLSPKTEEGTVDDFGKKLKDELLKVFQLKCVNIETILTDGIGLNDYDNAIYNRKFNNIDCAIIVVSEVLRNLPDNISPYYFCKAKYIGQSIPTQEIQIEKLKSSSLQFIVKNIALNLYAKLGGTPWGVEKTEFQKKEYIIGIGSTINDDKKLVMGIANIFDYTGKYFVGNCIPLSSFENYAEKLEELIYSQLTELIGSYSGEIRLIFHIFKSASSNYEIKAMSNVAERLKDKAIKYAFVHVGYGHNFRIFNNDGKYSVNKGFYINISRREALINFVDNSSLPLRLTVDWRSNFEDFYYLSKQIYWFSHLSYRSYLPSKKPVSILYPSLMARLTEKLKKVEGWDYNILKTVGDKLWFL